MVYDPGSMVQEGMHVFCCDLIRYSCMHVVLESLAAFHVVMAFCVSASCADNSVALSSYVCIVS